MKSNWDLLRQRSQYHFDNDVMDPRWDTVQQLGHINLVGMNNCQQQYLHRAQQLGALEAEKMTRYSAVH